MSRKHVLIIDDNSDFQQVLQQYLRTANVKISYALDGYSGIIEAVRTIPDAIILDINMPKYNGLEVLRGIRGDQELREIPIIILTNMSSQEAETEARLHAVEAYLIKAETSLSEIKKILEHLIAPKAQVVVDESLLMAQQNAVQRNHGTVKVPLRIG